MRSTPARLAGVIAVVVIALAGCGGDDDTAPTASEPSTTASDGATSVTTAPAGSGGQAPDATVSPSLPEEFAAEVGPVEVQGASLPELGDNDVSSDPARGMTAPVIIGENFDGQPVRIDPAVDGPTLAVFLAHWCPHCNREVPRVNELRDAGRFPANLNIVGVSTGIDPRRPNWPPSEWIQEMDWTYPVIADGVDMQRETFIAADAYGLDGFPLMVLIGDDGKVLARWTGESEPDEIIEMIEDNLPQ